MDIDKFDICRVDFGNDVIGSEQGGIRPAIIISNKLNNLHSSTVIVCPLTSQLKKLRQPTHRLIYKDKSNGLSKDSMTLFEAIRQISKERIISKVGHIDSDEVKLEVLDGYISQFTGKRNNLCVGEILKEG